MLSQEGGTGPVRLFPSCARGGSRGGGTGTEAAAPHGGGHSAQRPCSQLSSQAPHCPEALTSISNSSAASPHMLRLRQSQLGGSGPCRPVLVRASVRSAGNECCRLHSSGSVPPRGLLEMLSTRCGRGSSTRGSGRDCATLAILLFVRPWLFLPPATHQRRQPFQILAAPDRRQPASQSVVLCTGKAGRRTHGEAGAAACRLHERQSRRRRQPAEQQLRPGPWRACRCISSSWAMTPASAQSAGSTPLSSLPCSAATRRRGRLSLVPQRAGSEPAAGHGGQRVRAAGRGRCRAVLAPRRVTHHSGGCQCLGSSYRAGAAKRAAAYVARPGTGTSASQNQ